MWVHLLCLFMANMKFQDLGVHILIYNIFFLIFCLWMKDDKSAKEGREVI